VAADLTVAPEKLANDGRQPVDITLIRHATLVVSINGLNLLIDPMFSQARFSEAIRDTPNQQRNPLVELPLDDVGLSRLLDEIDAVLVTHTHSDHWDDLAQNLLAKDLPVFCQPEDSQRIREAGFDSVQPIAGEQAWKGLRFLRTDGRHGRGKIGEVMAPVSGFVIQAEGEPVLYIAGDTLWCPEVEESIRNYQPEIIVVNAGAAQFSTGGPITMTADDVIDVCHASPGAEVVAVHMEAINHCLLSRDELQASVTDVGVDSMVKIPADGETMSF
jgi:L-ascorbate metabolism protein UlaG (beta-lactamase superfamily)